MEPTNTFKSKFQKQPEHKINDLITHPSIRISGENIESKICTLEEALLLAQEMELDLVEINGKAIPPVCKIVDYGKFLYEQKKKKKEIIQGNKVALKEIRLSPNIQENDINFKSKHAIDFLKDGHKVKISMAFRGRQIAFKQNGEIVMLKFIQLLEEVGKPEFLPKFEGKNLYVTITSKVSRK